MFFKLVLNNVLISVDFLILVFFVINIDILFRDIRWLRSNIVSFKSGLKCFKYFKDWDVFEGIYVIFDFVSY